MIDLFINRCDACETAWQGHIESLEHSRVIDGNLLAAKKALSELGCDKVLLESLDGSNHGLESLIGEPVDWKNMGSYDLHIFKKNLIEKLDAEHANALASADAAIEGLWSNIRERVQLFLSFEFERKECIKVLKEQADELTSVQKAELENTVVSYATFDYKTAKLAVDSLKNAIAMANKYMGVIQKYSKVPTENLNDMDQETIADIKEKFDASVLGNEEAQTFFANLITKRVAGKTYKELGYTVGNISDLAQDVARNVMNFYKELDKFAAANKRLGDAEAKKGNYGTSDLWAVYSDIFKILRDADRCYKTVEAHLFRTQQKVVRYVNANKAAEAKNNQQ